MTTGTAAPLILPDICQLIELAWKGEKVVEIFGHQLVPRHRERPIGAHDFTEQDAHDAARNLCQLCQAFMVDHPDARFAWAPLPPPKALFEDVDMNDWKDGRAPLRPISDRIFLKVYPRPVDDPKVCVTLGWKFGSGSRRKFRVIVDGTYVTIEDQRQDRLGEPFWMPYDDSRSVSSEKLIGTALGAIVRGELERSYRNGVIYIDIPGDFEEED